MASRGRTGRIHPHQRDADFTGPLLGENIQLPDTYVTNIQSTEQHNVKVSTKRNYRNQLKQMYTYWKEDFPEYYSIGVRTLSEEELNDTTKFFWKNKHDIVYDGINPKFVKAFLSTKVKKFDGKTSSFGNIRKYFDTIQYGANKMGVFLPVSFYSNKDKYLQAFKKQVAKAKTQGDVEEREADPIPFGLYVLICQWAVRFGNIMMWVWSILQWNLLGRSVNV